MRPKFCLHAAPNLFLRQLSPRVPVKGCTCRDCCLQRIQNSPGLQGAEPSAPAKPWTPQTAFSPIHLPAFQTRCPSFRMSHLRSKMDLALLAKITHTSLTWYNEFSLTCQARLSRGNLPSGDRLFVGAVAATGDAHAPASCLTVLARCKIRRSYCNGEGTATARLVYR